MTDQYLTIPQIKLIISEMIDCDFWGLEWDEDGSVTVPMELVRLWEVISSNEDDPRYCDNVIFSR